MGKVLFLPGVDPDPPTRSELVDLASELVLQCVIDVFNEQRMNPTHLAIWLRAIRDYFWKQEIKVEFRRFREEDLQRWRTHWREQAFRDIESRRPR